MQFKSSDRRFRNFNLTLARLRAKHSYKMQPTITGLIKMKIILANIIRQRKIVAKDDDFYVRNT